MAIIQLTQGQVAVVDEDDHERISAHMWYALWQPRYRYFVAVRGTRGVDNRHQTIYMAREVMRAPQGLQVDHVNHDLLDNRKSNLRLATASQNSCNRRLSRANTTGLKGIFKYSENRWGALIGINRKQKIIGYFRSPEDAHAAYVKEARLLHGEFANPEGDYQ